MVMYSFRFWWWYSGPSLALRIFLEKQSSLLKPDIPSHWPVKKYPFMHLSIYCFKTTISNQKPVVASHVRLGWHLWTPANIIFKIFQMSLCATLSLSLFCIFDNPFWMLKESLCAYPAVHVMFPKSNGSFMCYQPARAQSNQCWRFGIPSPNPDVHKQPLNGLNHVNLHSVIVFLLELFNRGKTQQDEASGATHPSAFP